MADVLKQIGNILKGLPAGLVITEGLMGQGYIQGRRARLEEERERLALEQMRQELELFPLRKRAAEVETQLRELQMKEAVWTLPYKLQRAELETEMLREQLREAQELFPLNRRKIELEIEASETQLKTLSDYNNLVLEDLRNKVALGQISIEEYKKFEDFQPKISDAARNFFQSLNAVRMNAIEYFTNPSQEDKLTAFNESMQRFSAAAGRFAELISQLPPSHQPTYWQIYDRALASINSIPLPPQTMMTQTLAVLRNTPEYREILEAAQEQFKHEHGRAPTPEELASLEQLALMQTFERMITHRPHLFGAFAVYTALYSADPAALPPILQRIYGTVVNYNISYQKLNQDWQKFLLNLDKEYAALKLRERLGLRTLDIREFEAMTRRLAVEVARARAALAERRELRQEEKDRLVSLFQFFKLLIDAGKTATHTRFLSPAAADYFNRVVSAIIEALPSELRERFYKVNASDTKALTSLIMDILNSPNLNVRDFFDLATVLPQLLTQAISQSTPPPFFEPFYIPPSAGAQPFSPERFLQGVGQAASGAVPSVVVVPSGQPAAPVIIPPIVPPTGTPQAGTPLAPMPVPPPSVPTTPTAPITPTTPTAPAAPTTSSRLERWGVPVPPQPQQPQQYTAPPPIREARIPTTPRTWNNYIRTRLDQEFGVGGVLGWFRSTFKPDVRVYVDIVRNIDWTSWQEKDIASNSLAQADKVATFVRNNPMLFGFLYQHIWRPSSLDIARLNFKTNDPASMQRLSPLATLTTHMRLQGVLHDNATMRYKVAPNKTWEFTWRKIGTRNGMEIWRITIKYNDTHLASYDVAVNVGSARPTETRKEGGQRAK